MKHEKSKSCKPWRCTHTHTHTRSLLKEIKIENNKDSFKNHVSTHGF